MGENFVFLVIFDTCDVVYNWSISLLPPIVYLIIWLLPRGIPYYSWNKTPIDGLPVNSEESLWFYFQDVGPWCIFYILTVHPPTVQHFLVSWIKITLSLNEYTLLVLVSVCPYMCLIKVIMAEPIGLKVVEATHIIDA